MKPDEARHSGRKNVLTRVVGSRETVEVDMRSPPHTLAPGDTFVLCSDGLHGLVEDDEIRRTVTEMEPQEACGRLVTLARDRGGPDNITVQVVSWMREAPVRAAAERVPGETTRVISRLRSPRSRGGDDGTYTQIQSFLGPLVPYRRSQGDGDPGQQPRGFVERGSNRAPRSRT
jgi:hypothetical protein